MGHIKKMVETLQETFKVEAKEDEQCFLVHWSRVDKLTAEEMLQNYENLKQNLEQSEHALKDLDSQKEKALKQLTTSINTIQPRLDAFNERLNTAKVWKALHEKADERTPKTSEADKANNS